jgi:hypothetical protein
MMLIFVTGKSMSKTLFHQVKHYLLWISLLCMEAGFISGRAVVSIGTIVFVVTAFADEDLFRKLRQFYSSFAYWSVQLLFILPFLSFFWSTNKTEWRAVMQLKLPLLLLPAAFYLSKDFFSKENVKCLLLFAIAVGCIGSGWSFVHYLLNSKAINNSYLVAKIFATPMGDEHIKFSQFCAICILFLLMTRKEFVKQWQKLLWGFLVIWFVLYLHVLAARMGILMLYVLMALYFLFYLFRKKTSWIKVGELFLVIMLCVASYMVLPTLKNRIQYNRWDFEQYSSGNFLAGLNDAPRVLSLRAGYEIFQSHPIIGIGAGDIKQSLYNWYEVHHPQYPPEERMYLNNEWLTYACSNGLMGLLIFTLVVCYPLGAAWRYKRKEYLFIHLLMLCSFFVDVTLNSQYSILFYTLLVYLTQRYTEWNEPQA